MQIVKYVAMLLRELVPNIFDVLESQIFLLSN